MPDAVMEIPRARSPIALHPTAAGPHAVEIADHSALAKLAVRAPAGGAVQVALGTAFGRATRDGIDGALVVGSGPGEWHVLSRTNVREPVERLVAESGEFASVVDLTHGRALVRITGPGTAQLLAKLCAVDLDDTGVPDGAAFRSSVARVTTDVIRDDVRTVRSYLLHCERSSGQYLAGCLLDAGREFGIGVGNPVTEI